MHAVEASEEGYILYKIASTPQQVVKEMLLKNSKQRVTALPEPSFGACGSGLQDHLE